MRRALLMGTLKAGANGGKYRQRVAAYIPRPRSRRISGVSMRRLPSGNNSAPKCALVAFLATSAAGISCKSVARWQIASDAIRAHATVLLPSHFVRASTSVSLETSWTVLSGLEDARLAMHIFLGTPRRRVFGVGTEKYRRAQRAAGGAAGAAERRQRRRAAALGGAQRRRRRGTSVAPRKGHS